jgi:hypothetical protein
METAGAAAKGATAMSEQERRSYEACDHYAPLLAMLDDLPEQSETFGADERAAAREHLAGCAHCQADQRAFAQLDHSLRRAFGPAVASPLHTSDLLATIGATREPAAPARAATRPRRGAIRSVIYLGDFDGGFDRMSEHDERGAGRDDTGTQAAPARKMAAIPSLRPGPRERVMGRQRWAAAFGATAAAVALVVVVAALFATHARPPAMRTAAHGAATQTAGAKSHQAGAATPGQMAAVAMDSPTDGWALGDATGPQPGSVQTSVSALYHFDGAQWTLKQRVKGFSAFGAPGGTLTMLSANDGWAFTGNLLHYDGVAWRPATLTVAGDAVANLMAFEMISPTQGWAVAYLNNGSSTQVFLRYDGSQWSVDKSSVALPADLDPATLKITHIAAAPGGDSWAIGWAFVRQPTATNNDQGNPGPQVGLIFHRVNGGWRLATQVSLPSGVTSMLLNDLLMTSPTSGWIVGQISKNATMIGGGKTTITQPLLLRYDGVSWTAVPAPPDVTTNDDTLQQIVASGPDNIWVNAQTNGATIGPNGASVSATFLHYDGKAWSEVTPTFTVNAATSASVASIGLTSSGQLWAVGSIVAIQNQQASVSPLFCLYANGAWSVVTPVASGA